MPKTQTRIEDLSKEAADKSEAKTERKPSSRTRTTTSAKQDKELRDRLADCFDRIADALSTRGDEELASIIEEDAEVMSAGIVSMTRPLKALRMPVLAFVAFVEPALAFGRIFRVLAVRFAARRQTARMQAEWEREQAQAEADENAQ